MYFNSVATAGFVAQGPLADPIGTRLMLSTPPPIAASAIPAMTFAAQMLTASRPDEQKRLIWNPGTFCGRPA